MLRRLSVPLVVVLLLVAAVLPVLAQGDGGEPRSFAAAFFLSRKADGSIEILGSMIIWFLLALSMLSIGLMGHMALTNQRKSIVPDGVVDEVGRLLRDSKFKEAIELTGGDQSFFSRVLHGGLVEANNGFGAMIRGIELVSDEETTLRLRRIEYLNVLGQVTPMIGLFGTVYGMIRAFQAIVVHGGSPDPTALAGGIGTALTTTFWGLIVAIPALAAYAIIRNRIDALTTEATHDAEQLINQFRPKSAPRRAPEPKPQA